MVGDNSVAQTRGFDAIERQCRLVSKEEERWGGAKPGEEKGKQSREKAGYRRHRGAEI